MTRDEARAELNRRPLTDFYHLERSRNGASNQYICPICGSGNGTDHTGALTIYPSTNRLYCFKCADEPGTFGGKGQDTLGALRLLWGCSEREALEKAGYTVDTSNTTYKKESIQPPSKPTERHEEITEPPKDFTSYYQECRERLQTSKAAISYLQARGISLDTAAEYWIGFDPAADPAQSKHPAPRIILPTSKSHYVARSIEPNTPKAFQKMNPKGEKPSVFNTKVLKDTEKECVFVVEGIFDALSIIEVGADAIALNSTSNAGKLIEKLEQERTTATLILCFDNDDAGRKCTKTLKEGLQRLNISYVVADICGGHNDPNDALKADRATFAAAIRAAEMQTAARPDSVSNYIDNLMSGEIDQFRESKDRKTGFSRLDDLAKGLYAGLYVVAAISSLGKTTLCHQIADQLAQAGEDVLFFSLEQSRLELVSKSIARKTAQNDIATAVNSLSIRRGYLPERVLTAAEQYKAAISDRLSIIEGNFACNISFIGDYIRRYIQKTGKKPVVFVDYLQILHPEQDDRGRTQSTKETIDTTVTELKRISREHGLTIFAISSVNRANYLTPISFESLKESGGIEYTADVIWGLQLRCMNDAVFDSAAKIKEKRKKVKDAKAETPRKIELVCLKNRYGISSYSAYFDYYPEFDLFVEDQTDTDDETEKPTKRL